MIVFGTRELWSRLKNKDKPILLYGMGNGADKIIKVLDSLGISVDGVFASDGFARGNHFHGMKVMSYAEASEKFGDFTVLISFGSSLPDVIANMKRIAAEKETYAPDVPVAGDEIFDADFYLKNEKNIDAARKILADDASKTVYDEIIKYKLDGDISHFRVDSEKDAALKTILSGGYGAYIDLGAYNGDTIREAITCFPSIKKITALEPSPRIFKKLEKNAVFDGRFIQLYNCAAWSEGGVAGFVDGAGRNSQISGESPIQAHDSHKEDVKLAAVDSLCDYKNEKLLIKLDVEGSESAALDGMRRIISENDCELIVSAYHRSEDIFSLPLKLKILLPHRKIYLRKHPYVPAWDIKLYVTK